MSAGAFNEEKTFKPEATAFSETAARDGHRLHAAGLPEHPSPS